MHTLVHLVLALAATSIVLMTLAVLILIQTIDLSIEDESWSESDVGGDREPRSNPACTAMPIPDSLSAGGWPDLTLADQLPSPAGEPSVDLTVIYQSTLICPKKRIAATRTRPRRRS
jgi:hypothetical protein